MKMKFRVDFDNPGECKCWAEDMTYEFIVNIDYYREKCTVKALCLNCDKEINLIEVKND